MKKEYIPATVTLIELELDENIAYSGGELIPEQKPGEIFPDDEDQEGF